MDRATRAALLAIVLALAGGFLFFLGYNLFFAPGVTLLTQFRTAWILRQATLGVVNNLTPLVVAALLITYSIIINPESLASEATVVTGPFDNIRGPLIVLTLLTMAYTGTIGLAADGLQAGTSRLVALSESAMAYRDEAIDAIRRGDSREALGYLRLYQAIAGRNAGVMPSEEGEMLTVARLIADTEARNSAAPAEPRSEPLLREEEPLSAEENALRAQEFLEEGDYVNAHYYARRALQLQPNWQRALDILTRARQNLDEPGEELLEQGQQEIFGEKQRGLKAWEDADVDEGYRALNRGRVIDAFLIFRELRNQVPEDRDVQRYYNEARRALQNQALTVAEMTSARNLPGIQNILYAGYWQEDRGLVKIGSLVPGNTASFAYDVEFLRFDEQGTVVEHFQAEAGKLIDTTLYFRLIDEESEPPGIMTTAEWIQGTPPSGEPLLSLGYGAGELALFAASEDGAPVRGITGQVRMLGLGPEAGYHGRAIAADLTLQFVRPFALIVLSLAAIGFGWSNRSKYLRRPLGLLIPALIVAPFVAKVIYELYMEAHRSIVLLVLQSLELSTTLVVVVVVELALLFGSIFYLAREVNKGSA